MEIVQVAPLGLNFFRAGYYKQFVPLGLNSVGVNCL